MLGLVFYHLNIEGIPLCYRTKNNDKFIFQPNTTIFYYLTVRLQVSVIRQSSGNLYKKFKAPYTLSVGPGVAWWLRRCATSRTGPGIDSRLYHWIFQWHISFRPYHGPGVDSAPSENEYQEHFLEVKASGAWGWRPYHHHVPNVMKIWEPKPPGTLWVTPGLFYLFFTLSVQLSEFTVWRHTWRKNWVNCVVLTGNSAGLRTVFPVVFHTENCAVHSGNPIVFLSLPADATMASSQGTSVSSNSFSRWTSHDIFLFKYTSYSTFYAFFSSFR
jgi:hypothetical protein